MDNRNVIGMQEIKLMYFNFKKLCLAAMKFCKQKGKQQISEKDHVFHYHTYMSMDSCVCNNMRLVVSICLK